MKDILFGEYMTYRIGQRGFVRERIEEILRYSPDRYLDMETGREGSRMSNMKYFEKEDTIHILIKEGREAKSVEISPNITVELNDENEIIGIEILNASTYLRDNLLDTVQAKLLDPRAQ